MSACFAFQVQVTPKLELNLCTDSCTSFVCIGLYIYLLVCIFAVLAGMKAGIIYVEMELQ